MALPWTLIGLGLGLGMVLKPRYSFAVGGVIFLGGDLKIGGLKTAKDRVSKVVGVCLNMADNAISVILHVFFSKLN